MTPLEALSVLSAAVTVGVIGIVATTVGVLHAVVILTRTRCHPPPGHPIWRTHLDDKQPYWGELVTEEEQAIRRCREMLRG